MKIRHKQSGVELEGQFEDGGGDFKEPASTVLGASFYSKQHWEEAKPQWVDVGDQMLGIMHHLPDGLRLRKVRMYLFAEDPGQWLTGRDAFIVERRNHDLVRTHPARITVLP